MEKNTISKKRGVNALITSFFLEKTRLTLLSLFSLVLFGVVSVLSLKTVGFPSPSINIAIVNTIYPGASSNTILEQVTKPIESAVKDIEGVKSYSSTSRNNVSTLQITLDESANADAVKSKIDTALNAVTLPENAQKPKLFSPRVDNDEYYFALVSNKGSIDNQEAYEALQILKKEITKDTAVESITFSNELKKKVVINLDEQKMLAAGITPIDVTNALRGLNLSIPITEDANLDNKRYNISLSLEGKTIDDIKSTRVFSTTRQRPPVSLEDVGIVTEEYLSSANVKPYLGQNDSVSEAVLFSLNTANSADLNKYNVKLHELLDTYFVPEKLDATDLTSEQKALFKKFNLIEVYSQNTENQDQVNEVVAGLVGEKWHIGPLGYIGFVFGGIQLVFLVMLFLVSWRAAVIAALALPLSFFFSTIWVKFSGNELNTLVLFSLVLVIGLVVDPALVLLETIQRNLDKGLSNKEAVITSLREIGTGLFLAVLTSILVFVPFGVVSGIFGEIISYIPLTIIPALIGSYVVPLIFLSWISSKFLKRKKGKADNEEENLWRISRGMMQINRKILHSPVWVRVLLILFAIIIPFGIAGYYLGTEKVKSVQFAQQEDGKMVLISTDNFPQKTFDELERNNRDFVTEVSKNPHIKFVTPFGGFGGNGSTNVSYLAVLKDKSERKGVTATTIANDINKVISEKYNTIFFFAEASVLGAGPGNSSFPIAIAIKTNDLDVQKSVARDITKILNTLCDKRDKTYEVVEDCNEDSRVIKKIDNGYDAKPVEFIEVLLDKDKLARNPVNPLEVRTILSNQFSLDTGNVSLTLPTKEEDLDIVLKLNNTKPSSVEALQTTPLRTLDGRTIKLSDIAEVNQIQSVGAIKRVKGETVGVISAKPSKEFESQAKVAQIQASAIKEFNDKYSSKYSKDVKVENYSEGDTASIAKSFTELGIAFLLAVILTYVVLVVFFNSFTQPLVILFSIPLTFLGIFPALALFAGGQLGFLEIIGIIILVGLVENVAIFLIDAANQRIKEGVDEKEAIAYASGLRLRPIILTKITTLVSTAPLAILSEFYRSLSVVIIFGLLTSGVVSLFITPTLFIFFRWLSAEFRSYSSLGKLLFFVGLPVLPLTLLVMYIIYRKRNH